MWVIKAILISSVSPATELSYFSSEHIEEGSVITIPIGAREGFGLVTKVAPLEEEKQNLKENSYTLRKLRKPEPKVLFRRSFLRAMYVGANESGHTAGSLISAFTPTAILKRKTLFTDRTEEETGKAVSYEPLVLTQSRRDRVAEYKRLSREALARNASLLIICPTVYEVRRIYEELRVGIEEYVEAIHSELSEKKLVAGWQNSVEVPNPRIIVGTLYALSIPRKDIKTIIVEREGSRSYDSNERPQTRGVRIAEEVAKASGARFILASTAPSIEVAFRKLRGEILDYGISTVHLSGPNPIVVDLKALKFEKGKYNPLSPQALGEIVATRAEGKRVLVVATRRGLAPLTVCDDCGTTLACAHCGATLVLHRKDSPIYLCHQCGAEESASVRCRKCTGWRLTTLGISVERVAESLQKQFESESVLMISTDSGSKRDVEKVLAKWNGKGAGILVATERVLPYLPDLIPCIVVASVDSYLGIPEYSASESACVLLCELRTRSEASFILQSRNKDHRAMKAVQDGILTSFYRDELRDREKFGYPPFSTLVRLSVQGKAEKVETMAQGYIRALESLSPVLLIGQSARKGISRLHVLLRLPKGTWVDGRLLRFIHMLPPSIEVRVDPKNIHTG